MKVGERFTFEPGQFAFLKIMGKGFVEYHPFTISSGIKDDNICFTMKVRPLRYTTYRCGE